MAFLVIHTTWRHELKVFSSRENIVAIHNLPNRFRLLHWKLVITHIFITQMLI